MNVIFMSFSVCVTGIIRWCPVIIFLLLLSRASWAQTGSVAGTVTSSQGLPVKDISVNLDGNKNYGVTDSNGHYRIADIPFGRHLLMVLTADSTLIQSVTISSEKTIKIDFEIAPLQLQQVNEVNVTGENLYVTNKASASLRLNVPLPEIPQSIQITSRQTIKDLGLIATEEIFRTAAGAAAYNASGQDATLMMRGIVSYGSELRNGIGTGYFYNQQLDAALIETAEFVMGPAGFLISNNDPGGIVNIVTKQPTSERTLAVHAGFGSFKMMRASVDIGGACKKGAAFTYRLNAGVHYQKQHYNYGYLHKYFIDGALKWEWNNFTNVTFEYNYNHGKSLNDNQYLPTINGRFFEVPADLSITDPNCSGVSTHDQYLRLNFNHRWDAHWSVSVQLGAVNGAWRAGNMYFNTDASVTNDTIYRNPFKDNYENKLYAATACVNGDFSTGKPIHHNITGGLDFGYVKLKDRYEEQYGTLFGLYYPNPSYYLPKNEVNIEFVDPSVSQKSNQHTALYLQDHMKVCERFIITLAARLTQAISFDSGSATDKQHNLKLTPRFGFTYLFSGNQSMYMVFDQAFVPQIGKTFSGSALMPLTGNNKELGWKSYWFDKKLSSNVALYWITMNNRLSADLVHPGFQLAIGQMVSKGVEINVNGLLSKNIVVAANYSYSDVRVTQSQDPAQEVGLYNFGSTVHQKLNLFLKYHFLRNFLSGCSVGAGFKHADKFSSSRQSNQFAPGYNLLEAAAGYSKGRFELSLNVYNLTNAKYVTYAFKYNNTDWGYTPGQPINFRVGIGYRL